MEKLEVLSKTPPLGCLGSNLNLTPHTWEMLMSQHTQVLGIPLLKYTSCSWMLRTGSTQSVGRSTLATRNLTSLLLWSITFCETLVLQFNGQPLVHIMPLSYAEKPLCTQNFLSRGHFCTVVTETGKNMPSFSTAATMEAARSCSSNVQTASSMTVSPYQ